MALPQPIPYTQLIELVAQLPEEQQQDLIKRLLTRRAHQNPLSIEEKLQLLDAVKVHGAVDQEPSVRRVDWYGDDGR